jgi:hypothetical protein
MDSRRCHNIFKLFAGGFRRSHVKAVEKRLMTRLVVYGYIVVGKV